MTAVLADLESRMTTALATGFGFTASDTNGMKMIDGLVTQIAEDLPQFDAFVKDLTNQGMNSGITEPIHRNELAQSQPEQTRKKGDRRHFLGSARGIRPPGKRRRRISLNWQNRSMTPMRRLVYKQSLSMERIDKLCFTFLSADHRPAAAAAPAARPETMISTIAFPPRRLPEWNPPVTSPAA
jgi:hypothetical protein